MNYLKRDERASGQLPRLIARHEPWRGRARVWIGRGACHPDSLASTLGIVQALRNVEKTRRRVKHKPRLAGIARGMQAIKENEEQMPLHALSRPSILTIPPARHQILVGGRSRYFAKVSLFAEGD